MGDGYEPSRKAKVVGAIEWAAVGYSASSVIWQVVTDYYLFVRDAFGLPELLGGFLWVLFVVSTLGGLVGGYVWVKRRTDSAERERREHRKRVAFLFVLLALGVVALVLRMAVSELLGDQFYTVPYFLVPSVLDLFVLAGAFWSVYVIDADVIDAGGRMADGAYRPSRTVGLVGGVQWAVTVLYLGLLGFVVLSQYLVQTRESVSLNPTWELIAVVTVAFVAGYVWARRSADSKAIAREAHSRRVEYVVSLFAFGVGLGIVSAVAAMVVQSLGFGFFGFVWFGTVAGLSLLLAYFTTYVADLDLLDRLLST